MDSHMNVSCFRSPVIIAILYLCGWSMLCLRIVKLGEHLVTDVFCTSHKVDPLFPPFLLTAQYASIGSRSHLGSITFLGKHFFQGTFLQVVFILTHALSETWRWTDSFLVVSCQESRSLISKAFTPRFWSYLCVCVFTCKWMHFFFLRLRVCLCGKPTIFSVSFHHSALWRWGPDDCHSIMSASTLHTSWAWTHTWA